MKYDKENTVQLDLTNLVDWSKNSQQPFNAKKCKAMHLGTNNPKLAYQMNGHTLENTSSEKDLGVLIDDSMKLHLKTAAATKEVNQILGVIKRSYQTRDTLTMSTLYKSMVRPHFE